MPHGDTFKADLMSSKVIKMLKAEEGDGSTKEGKTENPIIQLPSVESDFTFLGGRRRRHFGRSETGFDW